MARIGLLTSVTSRPQELPIHPEVNSDRFVDKVAHRAGGHRCRSAVRLGFNNLHCGKLPAYSDPFAGTQRQTFHGSVGSNRSLSLVQKIVDG